MYDSKLYIMDSRREHHSAELGDGAVLYRLASLSHWEKHFILTGDGAANGTSDGRYHRTQQRASYCANNITICLAEILYHMYRRVLDGIYKGDPTEQIRLWQRQLLRLVVFKVKKIDSIVYADADAVRVDYHARITGSTVVFPDPRYEPLQHFSEKARSDQKRGIAYPSARHSVDVAYVFFRNESESILPDVYEARTIQLQLIPEYTDVKKPPAPFSVFKDKLHATMGYYEFLENPESLRDERLFYPLELPDKGYVDFVRRPYRNYPLDAFFAC